MHRQRIGYAARYMANTLWLWFGELAILPVPACPCLRAAPAVGNIGQASLNHKGHNLKVPAFSMFRAVIAIIEHRVPQFMSGWLDQYAAPAWLSSRPMR